MAQYKGFGDVQWVVATLMMHPLCAHSKFKSWLGRPDKSNCLRLRNSFHNTSRIWASKPTNVLQRFVNSYFLVVQQRQHCRSWRHFEGLKSLIFCSISVCNNRVIKMLSLYVKLFNKRCVLNRHFHYFVLLLLVNTPHNLVMNAQNVLHQNSVTKRRSLASTDILCCR